MYGILSGNVWRYTVTWQDDGTQITTKKGKRQNSNEINLTRKHEPAIWYDDMWCYMGMVLAYIQQTWDHYVRRNHWQWEEPTNFWYYIYIYITYIYILLIFIYYIYVNWSICIWLYVQMLCWCIYLHVKLGMTLRLGNKRPCKLDRQAVS